MGFGLVPTPMKQPNEKLFRSLGQLFRATRESLGLSFREVSLRSGLPTTTIDRIERGEAGAPLVSVIRISHALVLEQLDVTAALNLKIEAPYTPSIRRHPAKRNRGPIRISIADLEAFLLNCRDAVNGGEVLGLQGFTELDLQWLAMLDRNIIEIPGISHDPIWKAVEDGLVITLEDADLYVADLRRIQGMTLQAFSRSIGLAASFLYRLEVQQVETIRLVEVLQLDAGLDQRGRIFNTYWAGSMFELWTHGFNVFSFNSNTGELSEREKTTAKNYVRLIRTDNIVKQLNKSNRIQLWQTAGPKFVNFGMAAAENEVSQV